jgi:hypothetical protein
VGPLPGVVGRARAEGADALVAQLAVGAGAQGIEDPRGAKADEARAADDIGQRRALAPRRGRRRVGLVARIVVAVLEVIELDHQRALLALGELDLGLEVVLAAGPGGDDVLARVEPQRLEQGPGLELLAVDHHRRRACPLAPLDLQLGDPLLEPLRRLIDRALDLGQLGVLARCRRRLVVDLQRLGQLAQLLLAEGDVEEHLWRLLHRGDLLELLQRTGVVAPGLDRDAVLEQLARPGGGGVLGVRGARRQRQQRAEGQYHVEILPTGVGERAHRVLRSRGPQTSCFEPAPAIHAS